MFTAEFIKIFKGIFFFWDGLELIEDSMRERGGALSFPCRKNMNSTSQYMGVHANVYLCWQTGLESSYNLCSNLYPLLNPLRGCTVLQLN